MNKQNNLAYFTLFLVGLLSLFSINISAQKGETQFNNIAEKSTKTCSGEKFVMPASIAVDNDAFGDFIKVASLPMTERKEAFSKLSNEQKAVFIKVNLALQFVKRPNMSKAQKEFVLDSISSVSPDLWDKSDSEKVKRNLLAGDEIVNKAFALFTLKEAGDFIEPLNTDKSVEISLIQKYEDLLKNGMRARKRIAKEFLVNDRVSIWKTQLAYHLATGKFSKAQNEFILEFLTSLSPDTFASRASLTKEEETKALETLESSIFAVFSKAEGYAIFMEIGIQKSVSDDPNLAAEWCVCRWYCASGGCVEGRCVMFPECGPFGNWDCTGRCTSSQP